MSLMVSDAEVRERLMATNEEFKRLAAEHHTYDKELEELSSRSYLNEDERIQEITLKKKKLLLKDQMYAMLQKYRVEMSAKS